MLRLGALARWPAPLGGLLLVLLFTVASTIWGPFVWFAAEAARIETASPPLRYQIEIRLGGQYDMNATPIIWSRVIEPQLRESSESERLSPIMK